ncbi:MAG: lysylphosphatidylglycerol synthase transmembrane domain-containing protein [Myxococcota bacterium]
MENLERKIIYGVGIGVAVYAAVVLYADLGSLTHALGGFRWSAFALALLLSTGNYVLRFVKWEIFLRQLDIRVPLGRSALIFTAGFTMSVTPGKMGEVLKSVLLRQSDQVPVARSAPVVLAERLTDFIALLVLAATGIGTYQYGTTALYVTAAAVVVSIAAVSTPAVALGLLGLIERLPLVKVVGPKLREAYEAIHILLKPGPLIATSVLSVASWGLECVAFWLVLHGFDAVPGAGVSMDLFGGTFVFAMTTILGAVSFMPGGLGVAEASMIGALMLLGMVQSEAVASAAAVLTRLATLWWAVGWGFIGFVLFQRWVGPSAPSAEPAATNNSEAAED